MRSVTSRLILRAALFFLGAYALAACAAADGPLAGDSALAQQAGGARTGSWVARVSLGSGQTWKKLNVNDIKVTPGARYSASIWARGSGRLQLNIVNGAWTRDLATVAIDATSSWQRFAIADFSIGSETKVQFSLNDALGGKSGEVYLDDAFFGPVGGANLLANPSFESGSSGWLLEQPFRTERIGAGTSVGSDPQTAPSSTTGTASAGGAHTGSWAAMAAVTGSPTWKKLIHYDTKVSRNTTYTGYIWARGRGKVRLDVVNAAWTSNVASVFIDATSTWTRYALGEFSSGNNDTLHFNVYDAVDGVVAGTIVLDDAFLGRPGGANLLGNAGFEEGSGSSIAEGPFRIESTTPPPQNPITPPDDPGDIHPDPDGPYFSEVDANGTGCPKGTWNTRISRDGLVFTTTFSAYEARLDASSTLVVKDCQLAIKIHAPAGRSFSVHSFSYSGFALLQPGVTGRQLASYSFQGQDQQAKAARTDLTGPFDDEFVFKDDVDIDDAVWSPCGVERDLNINTRILLQSSAPGPSGYMNLTAADGSARLVLKLDARNCSDFGGVR